MAPSAGGSAQEVQNFLSVGEMAPDIQVMGATRYGPLAQPIKLSDFRGETVVLAFFFRARSSG
jgi:peroxiredoxin Q/BCP